mmetsp:Transcript_27379/g.74050  ORF Transcript_27379/g.74050 Transcript_27379/m.74050 type:complete len:217 (-) Transcript_27379:925-1575(-)
MSCTNTGTTSGSYIKSEPRITSGNLPPISFSAEESEGICRFAPERRATSVLQQHTPTVHVAPCPNSELDVQFSPWPLFNSLTAASCTFVPRGTSERRTPLILQFHAQFCAASLSPSVIATQAAPALAAWMPTRPVPHPSSKQVAPLTSSGWLMSASERANPASHSAQPVLPASILWQACTLTAPYGHGCRCCCCCCCCLPFSCTWPCPCSSHPFSQ